MKNLRYLLLGTIIATLTPISVLADSQITEVSAPASTSELDSEIAPRSDVLVWKFKMINGKMYKRLYNETKKIWMGEWIPKI